MRKKLSFYLIILLLIGLGVVYICYTSSSKTPQSVTTPNVVYQSETPITNANIIEALLEDNSKQRELERLKELKEQRLARIQEYVAEGNANLTSVCKLIFGEYDTNLTLTHTKDNKNIIQVGGKFKVAYSVDLVDAEFVYNETTNSIELHIPQSAVGLEYCEPQSDILTLSETRSFWNKLMWPTAVAKREPLKSEAINLLLRDSSEYVTKSFDTLEPQATVAITNFINKIPKPAQLTESVEIIWETNQSSPK